MNSDPKPFRDLGFSTLVISQNSTKYKENSGVFTFLSSEERGLSRSRNQAIENSKADIALIADDDVLYCDNFEEKIKAGFKQFPDADILTFKIITPTGEPYKKYSPKAFKHDMSSIYRVSSVEIVIKPSKVKEAGIKFDERFGLGTEFPSSEETIFLNDALRKGLNIYYVPHYIVCHPAVSSGKVLNGNFFRSKGALIHRLYGNSIHLGLGVTFLLKQYLKPHKSISLFNAIKESVGGFNSITKV